MPGMNASTKIMLPFSSNRKSRNDELMKFENEIICYKSKNNLILKKKFLVE